MAKYSKNFVLSFNLPLRGQIKKIIEICIHFLKNKFITRNFPFLSIAAEIWDKFREGRFLKY